MSANSFASGSSGGVGLSRTSTPPTMGSSNFAASPQYYPTGNHQHSRRPPPPYYSHQHLSLGLPRTTADMKYGDSPLGQGQNVSFPSRDGYGCDNYFRTAAGSDMDSGDSDHQYSPPNHHPRRRQTIPGPIHQTLPTLPESHISDFGSPSMYGQMGMPDPHAPAFIPSRYR
jgi:hypothetical protein